MLACGMWARFIVAKDIILLNPCTENFSTCNLIISYTNPWVLYKFGWISMGNVRNRGRKSARKVLTFKEAENTKEKKREDSRNCRHSLDKQIVPIPPQQMPDVQGEEDNATLKEDGYRGYDIIDPLLNGQYYEEFNNYVTPNESVTQQQPWLVIQFPN